jgi:hypothetical protein
VEWRRRWREVEDVEAVVRPWELAMNGEQGPGVAHVAKKDVL